MKELSIFEKLSLSTIRIECKLGNGAVSSGTGFFFKFVDQGDSFVPAIVTNKHVIEGAENGFLLFTLSDKHGNPTHDRHHKFEITDFQKPWLNHPDPAVDLCVMPINTLVTEMQKKGIKPYITFLDFSILPPAQDIDEMAGLERVVMVGYPNSLWDAAHNQPVFRSGVLASHYKFDWNGRAEFVIDAACVPGSSGSPVLLIDIGQVFTKKGVNIGTSRIKLLGMLYAGPVLSADGSIEIIPAPALDTIRTRTDIPINLGYVIKADKLREFDAIFEMELKNNS
ncbi:MAG: serine protease [Thermodesulfobacteriota bacterium]|nr:serine protease [Thermodesulfobacteriota bacterium]